MIDLLPGLMVGVPVVFAGDRGSGRHGVIVDCGHWYGPRAFGGQVLVRWKLPVREGQCYGSGRLMREAFYMAESVHYVEDLEELR